MTTTQRTYRDAADRWAGIGPYYAMFPVTFANSVVKRYSAPGDTVLDPFAGRGTAIFSAAVSGRRAVGVEINPVGYVYARAKLKPASREDVEARLVSLNDVAGDFAKQARSLPEFFHLCFCKEVRRFLVAAREHLNWRRSRVDRTLMALLLVYLHGKEGAALSNQMRQAKAMSPAYSVNWWREREMFPPKLDPVQFIMKRLPWRYAKGTPTTSDARVYLGNNLHVFPRLRSRIADRSLDRASLLFTSPPYYGLTNYHYDQWLRLWLLGGEPNALRTGNSRNGKFEHREGYRTLLLDVFSSAAELLDKDAVIYVRTDRRKYTCSTTAAVLREVFPKKVLRRHYRPLQNPTQTELFGGLAGHGNRGEVDFVLR